MTRTTLSGTDSQSTSFPFNSLPGHFAKARAMYAQYVTSYEYDAANRLERTLLPMATGETQHYVYQELDKVASG